MVSNNKNVTVATKTKKNVVYKVTANQEILRLLVDTNI